MQKRNGKHILNQIRYFDDSHFYSYRPNSITNQGNAIRVYSKKGTQLIEFFFLFLYISLSFYPSRLFFFHLLLLLGASPLCSINLVKIAIRSATVSLSLGSVIQCFVLTKYFKANGANRWNIVSVFMYRLIKNCFDSIRWCMQCTYFIWLSVWNISQWASTV